MGIVVALDAEARLEMPAQILRQLGAEAGDLLMLEVVGEKLEVRVVGESMTEHAAVAVGRRRVGDLGDVEDAVEPGRAVGTDRQDLQHSGPGPPVVGGCPHEVLNVKVLPSRRIDLVEREDLEASNIIALPATVTMFGVTVAEPLHLESEHRLQVHGDHLTTPRPQFDAGGVGPSGPRLHHQSVVHGSHRLHGRRPRFVIRSEYGHPEAGVVPAAPVSEIVDVEMQRAVVEVDRCPEPEELRVGRGRS